MVDPSSPFDFRDCRVVIAGGSRGIGRRMALAFAQAGGAVSICARGEVALEETRKAMAAFGGVTHARHCDLAEAGDIDDDIAGAAEALGGIDILINNGTGFGFGDDEESWASGIHVDRLAAVRASRAVLQFLPASSRACILHTPSIVALRPRASGAPCAAAKRRRPIEPRWRRFRSVGSAHPKKWRMQRRFWHRPMPAGSPAIPWWSTAAGGSMAEHPVRESMPCGLYEMRIKMT